jgi:hypothetical protein
VVQENAQEEEEDENDAVVCNVTSACSSYTDCKLNGERADMCCIHSASAN